VPSLVLVAFGLIPVLILCRTLGRQGAGQSAARLGSAISPG